MDIATGAAETHPTPLPVDAAHSPGVAPPTPVASTPSPSDQTPARDLTGERLGQLAGYEQDAATAMHSGMAAETGRRSGYAADMVQSGPAEYGDALTGMPVIDPPWETPYFPSTNQQTP